LKTRGFFISRFSVRVVTRYFSNRVHRFLQRAASVLGRCRKRKPGSPAALPGVPEIRLSRPNSGDRLTIGHQAGSFASGSFPIFWAIWYEKRYLPVGNEFRGGDSA
jgi:hypothetical protein